MATYYRAVGSYRGEGPTFVAERASEAVEGGLLVRDEDGNAVRSDYDEVCVSKSISGAVLGALTCYGRRTDDPMNAVLHVYAVEGEPEVDLTGCREGDFRWTGEHRYRRNVTGKYVGCVAVSGEMRRMVDDFVKAAGQNTLDAPGSAAARDTMNMLAGRMAEMVERSLWTAPGSWEGLSR